MLRNNLQKYTESAHFINQLNLHLHIEKLILSRLKIKYEVSVHKNVPDTSFRYRVRVLLTLSARVLKLSQRGQILSARLSIVIIVLASSNAEYFFNQLNLNWTQCMYAHDRLKNALHTLKIELPINLRTPN